jgi:hypothetical protein
MWADEKVDSEVKRLEGQGKDVVAFSVVRRTAFG